MNNEQADKLKELSTTYSTIETLNRPSRMTQLIAHRYKTVQDRELAAIFAVSGFWAGQFVSSGDSTMDHTMMNEVDHAKAVEQFSAEDIPAFSNLAYRWSKHPGFVLAMFTFQLFTQYDTVGKLIESLYISEDTDLNDTLARLIAKHQGYAMESASSAGLNVTTFGDLPDGFKRFFSSPAKDLHANGGKCFFDGWFAQRRQIWVSGNSQLQLAIPLDVHVHSLSQMIGLTKPRREPKSSQRITGDQRIHQQTQLSMTLH